MKIKNPIFRWLVAAVSVFSASALGAQTLFSTGLQIEFREGYCYLFRRINIGDAQRFVQTLENSPSKCNVIRLNSFGGSGLDAMEIGTYIRNHRITTWTDGLHDKCTSACNRIFAGGVNRIYSNAKGIVTGKTPNNQVGQKWRGLGYHHPKLGGDFGDADAIFHHTVIPYLRAMLPPKAADWIYQADASNWTDNVIWLNGDTALELGISTSEQIPDGCTL